MNRIPDYVPTDTMEAEAEHVGGLCAVPWPDNASRVCWLPEGHAGEHWHDVYLTPPGTRCALCGALIERKATLHMVGGDQVCSDYCSRLLQEREYSIGMAKARAANAARDRRYGGHP